jgi:hypothetical protein
MPLGDVPRGITPKIGFKRVETQFSSVEDVFLPSLGVPSNGKLLLRDLVSASVWIRGNRSA